MLHPSNDPCPVARQPICPRPASALRPAWTRHLLPHLPLLALIIALGGCCAERFERPEQPIEDPEELLRRMHEHSARVQSFEYITRMSFYADNEARKGRVEILAKRPAAFRFEALTPTDDTVAVLISDGERFISHERGQPVCYTGQACGANVSRMLPMRFEGTELFELLSGAAPVLSESDRSQGGWDECEGAYRVLLERDRDQSSQEIWLRPDTFGAIKVRMTRAGELEFEIEMEDFETLDGILLPRTLSFESPHKDIDLSVELREVFLNGVDTGVPFKPTCPTGTTRQVLPCR